MSIPSRILLALFCGFAVAAIWSALSFLATPIVGLVITYVVFKETKP